MIIEKSLDDIELDDIKQLVNDGVQEGKEIEYTVYLDLDQQEGDTDPKEKLLGEITSFANARGGDFIIGVPDEKGTPKHTGGMPVKNVDKTVERWSNTIRRGADPKLPPSIFDIKELHVEDDRCVFVIRVNKSWNTPHRVKYNNRFYGRGPSGKFPLETAEIRRRILENERFADGLREFRADRVSEFVSGDTPLPVYDGPKLVFHLVPVSAFSPGQNIDRKAASCASKIRPWFLTETPAEGSFTDNFTVDSVIVHKGVPEDGLYEYVRTFSNGVIEMFNVGPFNPTSDGNRMLNIQSVRNSLELVLPHQLEFLNLQDVDPPIYGCMSVLDAEEYAAGHRALMGQHPITFDSVVQLPEVMIESYDADLDKVYDQIIEYLYNAGGLSGPRTKMSD